MQNLPMFNSCLLWCLQRYLIKVVEVKTSFVNGFRVPLTKDVSRLSSTVSNLERGATYHVSVSVDMSAPVYSEPVIITVGE